MLRTVHAVALAASRSSRATHSRPRSRRSQRRAPLSGKAPMSARTSAISGRLPATARRDPSGVAGGVQVGYNWQRGQFVFGGETDLQVSDADDRFASWKFSNPWFGTLRARAGFAMNNVLLYGTSASPTAPCKRKTR